MRRGSFSASSLFRALLIFFEYRFCDLGLQQLHNKAFHILLKGKKFSLIEEEMRQFLAADFYRFFYLPSFSRLRRAQHEGHYTVILSSSPSFIVGPIAEYLGVTHWQSSEYEIDQNGRLKRVKFVLSGEEKARYLAEFARVRQVGFDRVVAYSDSLLDLPFLLAAGKAIVVNPSKGLRQISKRKSWEII